MAFIQKDFFKRLIALSGYSIINSRAVERQRNTKPVTRQHVLDVYFANVRPDEFFFVQIGANDGITEDPIYPYVSRYKLHGLVIEPIPDVFALLQRTYRDVPVVTCLNLAVGDTTEDLVFYATKRERITGANPYLLTRTASFDKNIVRRSLKNIIPANTNPDDYIGAVPVKVRAFDEVLSVNNVTRIDFLQIDCEGYDYEILKQAHLEKYRPRIINFESKLLSQSDKEECEVMLHDLGYTFFYSGGDTVAYLQD